MHSIIIIIIIYIFYVFQIYIFILYIIEVLHNKDWHPQKILHIIIYICKHK